MLKIKSIPIFMLVLIYISFTACNRASQFGPRYSFLARCSKAKISEFTISADCRDDENYTSNTKFDFSKCLHNTGNKELSTRASILPRGDKFKDCKIAGNNLTCSCQQDDDSYKNCSILLNKAFFIDDKGKINCKT